MAVKIEHRLGVQAPAAVIWELLEDVSGWPAWNPLYPAAAGRIGYGELLKLSIALPDQPARAIEARILDWAPNEAIHWRTTALQGLVTMTRYLEIESLGETNAIFSNGEIFSGWFGARAARRARPQLKQGFAALGEAMKARAEGLWRERAGRAT
ncbi:MAG TPA: SRPBCC domain-containing protein [Caulobacteraceae bacterium]|nr:SRPBCC domain-containing protein [Caulobacteraceae bacterium]